MEQWDGKNRRAGVRELNSVEIWRLQNSLVLWGNLKLKTNTPVCARSAETKLATATLTSSRQTAVIPMLKDFLRRRNGIAAAAHHLSTNHDRNHSEQFDFEDYRDVDAVKLPFTIRVSSVDAGNPVSVRTFTAMKLNATIDGSKFKMPAASGP
jgi:hypothetical protein